MLWCVCVLKNSNEEETEEDENDGETAVRGKKRIACDEEEWRGKRDWEGESERDTTNGMEIENYRKLKKLKTIYLEIKK